MTRQIPLKDALPVTADILLQCTGVVVLRVCSRVVDTLSSQRAFVRPSRPEQFPYTN